MELERKMFIEYIRIKEGKKIFTNKIFNTTQYIFLMQKFLFLD